MEKETAIEKRSMLYKAVDRLRMLLNGMVAYIQRLIAKREEAKKKQARDAFIASAKEAAITIGTIILPLATTVTTAIISDRMKEKKKQRLEAERLAKLQREKDAADAKAERERAEQIAVQMASIRERERHNKAAEAEKERHNRALEERAANQPARPSKKNKAVDQQVAEAKTAVKELASDLSEKKSEFKSMAATPAIPDSSKAEVEKAVKDIEKREQEAVKIANEIKTVETEAKGGADPAVIEKKLENIQKKCLILRKGVTRGKLKMGPNGIGLSLSKQREYTQGANKIKEKWSETSTKGKHGKTLQSMRHTEKVVSGAKDDPAHIAKYQKLLGERKAEMEKELGGLGRQPLSVSSKRLMNGGAGQNVKTWERTASARMLEKKNNKQPRELETISKLVKRAKTRKTPRRLERMLSRYDRTLWEMAQRVYEPPFIQLSPHKPGLKFNPDKPLMYWPKEIEFKAPYKNELPKITITLDDYIPKDEKYISELKKRIADLNRLHRSYAKVGSFRQCVEFWEGVDKVLDKIDKIADPKDEEKFKQSEKAYAKYKALQEAKQRKLREEEEAERRLFESQKQGKKSSQAEAIEALEAALKAEQRRSNREKDRKRFNQIKFEGGSRPYL